MINFKYTVVNMSFFLASNPSWKEQVNILSLGLSHSCSADCCFHRHML